MNGLLILWSGFWRNQHRTILRRSLSWERHKSDYRLWNTRPVLPSKIVLSFIFRMEKHNLIYSIGYNGKGIKGPKQVKEKWIASPWKFFCVCGSVFYSSPAWPKDQKPCPLIPPARNFSIWSAISSCLLKRRFSGSRSGGIHWGRSWDQGPFSPKIPEGILHGPRTASPGKSSLQ